MKRYLFVYILLIIAKVKVVLKTLDEEKLIDVNAELGANVCGVYDDYIGERKVEEERLAPDLGNITIAHRARRGLSLNLECRQ